MIPRPVLQAILGIASMCLVVLLWPMAGLGGIVITGFFIIGLWYVTHSLQWRKRTAQRERQWQPYVITAVWIIIMLLLLLWLVVLPILRDLSVPITYDP